MGALRVNEDAMRRNLEASKEHIIAEPLYVLLALQGYPSAYERVRSLAREARERDEPLIELARRDPEIGPRIQKLRPEQLRILEDPINYRGQAYERTMAVCARWEREGIQLRKYLQQEKKVLETIKVGRFSKLYDRIRELEKGKPIPEDFCPAEDRRQVIETWIREEIQE